MDLVCEAAGSSIRRRGVDAEADVILKDGVVARIGKGIAGGLSG